MFFFIYKKGKKRIMVNKFNKISPQGKSLGKLTNVGCNKIGTNGDISVAVININDTLNTENITPQAGFDFAKPFSTELKLINASLIDGEPRCSYTKQMNK